MALENGYKKVHPQNFLKVCQEGQVHVIGRVWWLETPDLYEAGQWTVRRRSW